MELITTTTNDDIIVNKLGIAKERCNELYDILQSIYERFHNHAVDSISMIDAYAIAANASANLNEYTFCLHVLIFNLAQIGMPTMRDYEKE